MTWQLFRVKNGWLLTTEKYFAQCDVPNCFVFETTRALTDYLVQTIAESDKRDNTVTNMKTISKKTTQSNKEFQRAFYQQKEKTAPERKP